MPKSTTPAPSLTEAQAMLQERAASEMALLNVLINARDAMCGNGTVTIRTANLEAGRPGAAGEFGEL